MMIEPAGRPLALALSAVVLLAVGAGLNLIGSPAKARQHALDDRRVSDLRETKYQVFSYWRARGVLPATLDSLSPIGSDSLAYRDPETGAPYGYRVTGDSTYDLCAVFSYPSQGGYGVDPFRHPAGEYCFRRHVKD